MTNEQQVDEALRSLAEPSPQGRGPTQRTWPDGPDLAAGAAGLAAGSPLWPPSLSLRW